jgi:hypothetical protein
MMLLQLVRDANAILRNWDVEVVAVPSELSPHDMLQLAALNRGDWRRFMRKALTEAFV